MLERQRHRLIGFDTGDADEFGPKLRSDRPMMWVNETRHLTPLAASGGMKQSGIGVENGADSLLEYTITQTVARRR